MAKLWIFGDSFSISFEPKIESGNNWQKKYCDWKGYTPKVYGEIISDKLGLELNNMAIGGSNNYTIFEEFIKILDKVKSEDVLIFGWTDVGRFRLVNQDDEWSSILPHSKLKYENLEFVGQKTLDEISVNRMNTKYVDEINYYIKLINYSLKNNIVLHWTALEKKLKSLCIQPYETITIETKGLINDTHYNEYGQMEIADKLLNEYDRKLNLKFI